MYQMEEKMKHKVLIDAMKVWAALGFMTSIPMFPRIVGLKIYYSPGELPAGFPSMMSCWIRRRFEIGLRCEKEFENESNDSLFYWTIASGMLVENVYRLV